MSVEKITASIIEDATNAAEETVANAQKTIDEKLAEANKKAQEIIESATKRGKEEEATIKNRRVSVAHLEGRKMKLAAKQEMVTACFEKALLKLRELSDSEYTALLAAFIMKSKISGGEIMLTKEDAKRLGAELLAIVNAGVDGEKYTLSDEFINASGGFVIKKGDFSVNSTLETIVAGVREDITPKVVETLFN